MVFEFKFPDIGEGIAEGEIVEWFIKEGDVVKEHQALGRIETDKAVAEMPSPRAGKVLKIHHKPGDTVKVGETLVTIGEEGEILEEKKYTSSVVGFLEEAKDEEEKPRPVFATLLPPEGEVPIILATPATRRVARELGIDLTKVGGTGLGGRVTEEDVRQFAKEMGKVREEFVEVKVVKKYDMYGYVQRVPLKGIRKSIAKHMVQAKFTAPHVTHMDEANVTELYKIREVEKFKAAQKGVHLTFLPYVIKAVTTALKIHPYVNASLDEKHEEIILKKYYNIGIAADTPDGLIVPVVKMADKKDLLEIAKEIEDLAEKAKNRTIDLGDLKGGTFTVTNIGVIGGTHATPIINYPEAAILATGRIQDRATAERGEFVIRKILPLSLSFDHRIFDGAEAARFVNDIKTFLENPKILSTGKD